MIAIPPSNINRKMTFIRRILFLNICWGASIDCRVLRGRPRTLPRTSCFARSGTAAFLRTRPRISCYSHEVLRVLARGSQSTRTRFSEYSHEDLRVATRVFAEHTPVASNIDTNLFVAEKIRSHSIDINDIDTVLNAIFERHEYSFLRIFHYFKKFSHLVDISAQYFSFSSPENCAIKTLDVFIRFTRRNDREFEWHNIEDVI
jgi:hypothetical protein